MSQRSKNLLEAFNRSKAPEKSPEPVAEPRGVAPKAGGPFADAAPARTRPVAAPAPVVQVEPRPQVPLAVPEPPRRWRVVASYAAVAFVFFWVGRVSVGSVGAADGSGADGTQSAAVAPGTPPASGATGGPSATGATGAGTQGSGAARSISDQLRDKTNQSTILATTYDHTETNLKTAEEARRKLVEQGLPAAVYQHQARKKVYLLVGAAPRASDLDGLLAKVKGALSQRNKPEFTSAYIVQIDTYLVSKDRK